MQETKPVGMDGSMENLREYFEGDTRKDTVDKMDKRLLELELEGHELVKREFYHENGKLNLKGHRLVAKQNKIKKKLARLNKDCNK